MNNMKGVVKMAESRIEKLLRACEIVKQQDEEETELMTAVARGMQLGYQLGKMDRNAEAAAQPA